MSCNFLFSGTNNCFLGFGKHMWFNSSLYWWFSIKGVYRWVHPSRFIYCQKFKTLMVFISCLRLQFGLSTGTINWVCFASVKGWRQGEYIYCLSSSCFPLSSFLFFSSLPLYLTNFPVPLYLDIFASNIALVDNNLEPSYLS